ncbi:MAG: diguanylate cyclase [Actinomycetota bacterium]
MRGTQAIIGHTEALPSRAIVEVPSLRLLDIERDRPDLPPGGPDDPFDVSSALELFVPAAADTIAGEILPEVLAGRVWSGELRCRTQHDGSTTAVTLWVPHHRGDQPPNTATILIGTAITEHATRVAPDPLTSLPTRVVLLDRLDQARRRSRRNGDLLAALFIDLDGLKGINDRHGHEEGDTALIQAAERIRTCMRDGDTVARFGGDEFVVLCESLEEEHQARSVAERILEKLTGDNDQPLSASIGIAFDHSGSLSALELVGRADAAMYRAKARGGARFEIFDSEMEGRIAADESLRTKLLAAISGDGLDVASQPLYELASGRVIGVELFIRLRDAGDELVSGADVLRLVREHSQSIDAAMLGRAIAVARNWRRELGQTAPRIHMNVSGQSLASGEFVRRVTEAFRRHHIGPHNFAFEVDTNDFVPMSTREIDALSELRAIGSGVVIDGYGVGPASLRLINQLRPNMVKVTALDTTRSRQVNPEVVVGLVRAVSSLGVGTCVKGIESQTVLERVVTAGTFAGQGNVLSPVGTLADIRPRLSVPARIGF